MDSRGCFNLMYNRDTALTCCAIPSEFLWNLKNSEEEIRHGELPAGKGHKGWESHGGETHASHSHSDQRTCC